MRISICIPHYNRAAYLLEVLESIRSQTYQDIEVIISDDCSWDDSETIIPGYISSIQTNSQAEFLYFRQAVNCGYDKNLRTSLERATGDYLLILGNDDALPNRHTIAELASTLELLGRPDVAYGNYFPYACPQQIVRRALSTAIVGEGPSVAVQAFRSFAFVAGIVFRRAAFEAHNTDKYDGTVYVQIFLGSRIIAANGVLATIDIPLVAKDVVVGGVDTSSYRDTLYRDNTKVEKKFGGLDTVAGVACEAILPYVEPTCRRKYAHSIYRKILTTTYPHWLHQYRKDGSFRAALNLALGCTPGGLMRYGYMDPIIHIRLSPLYIAVTLAGLFTPLWLLGMIKNRLYAISKGFDRQFPRESVQTDQSGHLNDS